MTYNVFSGTLNPTHFTSLLLIRRVVCVCVSVCVCVCVCVSRCCRPIAAKHLNVLEFVFDMRATTKNSYTCIGYAHEKEDFLPCSESLHTY